MSCFKSALSSYDSIDIHSLFLWWRHKILSSPWEMSTRLFTLKRSSHRNKATCWLKEQKFKHTWALYGTGTRFKVSFCEKGLFPYNTSSQIVFQKRWKKKNKQKKGLFFSASPYTSKAWLLAFEVKNYLLGAKTFPFLCIFYVIIHMDYINSLSPFLLTYEFKLKKRCACELVKRHVPTEIREGYVILLESNNRHLHRLECDAVILISAWTNIIILEIFRSLSFETSFDAKKIKARISFSILMIETPF